jgi:hypothetical protein
MTKGAEGATDPSLKLGCSFRLAAIEANDRAIRPGGGFPHLETPKRIKPRSLSFDAWFLIS